MNREPFIVNPSRSPPRGEVTPLGLPQGERKEEGGIEKLKAGPLMVRAYLNVRATGGAVFFPLRGENTRERWSPFKGEGDGGCSK